MEEKQHASKCKTNDVNLAAGNIIPRECDCDGHHTFNELYEHRITLFVALCKLNHYLEIELGCKRFVWRSKLHSDGTMFDESFILGINKDGKNQITYHIPISKWDETGFAETLERAPEWDGHTTLR